MRKKLKVLKSKVEKQIELFNQYILKKRKFKNKQITRVQNLKLILQEFLLHPRTMSLNKFLIQ